MCEITCKVQCQDCLQYCEIGIVYCTCGKCLQPSERNRQLNKERDDVLSIRIMWSRKIRLMELDTDRLKGNECITKPTILSGRQTKIVTKLCRPDSWTVRVIETHWLTLHEKRILVLHMTRAQKRTILTLRQEEKEADMRNHYIRETTTKKERRLATSCARSVQQLQNVVTQELFILKNTFDKDPTKNSRGTKRIRIGLIQKLGGGIIFLQQWVLLLHQPGVDRPTAGGQHGIGTLHGGMSIFLVPDVRFSLTGNRPSIPGGQNLSTRQTVFFTAVNPMHKNHKDPQEFDLIKPRLAAYKWKWKVHRDTVYWDDIQLAQRKRIEVLSNKIDAVILYATLPAYCFSKAIVMKSAEILYQKVYVSPRPPPTMSYTNNWMCILDLDVARSS